MRVTGFVVALGGFLLCAPALMQAQVQPAPLGVVAVRVADRPSPEALRSAADTGATRSPLFVRDFADTREVTVDDRMGRIGYIAAGAAVGAGVAAGVILLAKSVSDCNCESRSFGYAAATGAVVGGFLGSVAFGMRRDQGGSSPPASPARNED